MVKFGNPKNVFWEALLLTGVVFFFGILLGVAFESSRAEKINEYYAKSEISLMDVLALNNMIELNDDNCDILIQSNIELADKIYEEARLLEKYGDSRKVSDTIELSHKKYDVLRTFLWITSSKTLEKCEEDFSSVVYLYEYETEDLTKRATQNVWSKVLFDLKQEQGNRIILIPISVDNDLISLNSLIRKFRISRFPAVIINDENVLYELNSVEDLEKYLD